MFNFLISQTRLPIEQFFRNCSEKVLGKNTTLSQEWAELSFSPEDAKSSLGAVTDACVYYNDPEKEGAMCLSVSSYLDEVEIYFFVQIRLTDAELEDLNKRSINLETAAQNLSKELDGLKPSCPQKISIVSVIPEEHPEGVNSFYLVNEGNSISLYWADLEQGLVRKQTHSDLTGDEYQSILKDLFEVVESGNEQISLEILNTFLPEMCDHSKNVGHQLAASTRLIGSNNNLLYFNIHCAIQSGHNVKRFNVLKEGLPFYQKHFPAIPNRVIEKMAAFIDKHRDAYVLRRWQLANDFLADKEAAFASLKEVLAAKKSENICGLSSSYLFEVAQWIYARNGLESAKRLCEFILEYKNLYMDLSNTEVLARKMIVDILSDNRYPVSDRVANSHQLCSYLLQIAASSRDQEDIKLAINMLNSFSGFPYAVVSNEQTSYMFEVPLILHQAEQLRQLNERVKQLESQSVQNTVRFSPPSDLPESQTRACDNLNRM